MTPTGALATVWVVVRPHNWHPKETEEVLLELDADTGAELQVNPPDRGRGMIQVRGCMIQMERSWNTVRCL